MENLKTVTIESQALANFVKCFGRSHKEYKLVICSEVFSIGNAKLFEDGKRILTSLLIHFLLKSKMLWMPFLIPVTKHLLCFLFMYPKCTKVKYS